MKMASKEAKDITSLDGKILLIDTILEDVAIVEIFAQKCVNLL